ncbi:MAG TPA: plasmid stabilization protein [Pelotomaculum sp.]|nr:plasmid stabilization protein [Pelotomaculum sp.]
MLSVTFLPPAKQYLKKIKDKRLKKKYEEAITEIRKNPDIGGFKTGDLAGVRGYDIKHEGVSYEIAYRVTVNAQGDAVVIIMAGTRENFYETLKKYYKLI